MIATLRQNRVASIMHASWAEVVQAIAGLATIYGVIRFSSWARSRNSLIVELESVKTERDLYKDSAEAWQTRFESVKGQLDEFKSEMESKFEHFERKQSASTQFMCAMIIWGRDHKRRSDIPMPEIPEILIEDIGEALNRLAESSAKEQLYEGN